MNCFVSFVLLISLLGLSVQAEGACRRTKIVSPLENQPQLSSDWCSAAATQTVMSRFVDPPKNQCALMSDVISGANCCLDETGCHPDPAIWPHELFIANRYAYDPPLDYFSTPPSGPPSWERILLEICNNNRPLISIAAQLDRTDWHAVVVEGYRTERDGTQKVLVFDPQEDLCEEPSCGPYSNPRFFTYEVFFKSDFEHHSDYIGIKPPSN